jgi:hypothetical protein
LASLGVCMIFRLITGLPPESASPKGYENHSSISHQRIICYK